MAAAEHGLHTSQSFTAVMSLLVADVLADRVTVGQANAACNAARNILKMAELVRRVAAMGQPKLLTRRTLALP